MKKLLIGLLVLIVLISSGCEVISKEVSTVKQKTVNKVEAPEACEAIGNTINYDTFYHMFVLNYNKLQNGYGYWLNKEYNIVGQTGWHGFSCRDAEIGENVNYKYCEDIPISKREKNIDEKGIFLSDTETFYLMNLVIQSEGKREYQGIKHDIIERKCWKVDFKDYSK